MAKNVYSASKMFQNSENLHKSSCDEIFGVTFYSVVTSIHPCMRIGKTSVTLHIFGGIHLRNGPLNGTLNASLSFPPIFRYISPFMIQISKYTVGRH